MRADHAAVMHDRLEIAMSARAGRRLRDRPAPSERWTSPQYQELAGAKALARHSMRPFGMYRDDDILAVRESWERCLRSPAVDRSTRGSIARTATSQWVRIFMRVQRNEQWRAGSRCRTDAGYPGARSAPSWP